MSFDIRLKWYVVFGFKSFNTIVWNVDAVDCDNADSPYELVVP
jgi:hypothetical protein